MSEPFVNRPAPGVNGYFPLNEPPIGSALPVVSPFVTAHVDRSHQGMWTIRKRIRRMPSFPCYSNPLQSKARLSRTEYLW